jgi:small-conductance mechanosensitive channel
MSPKDDEDAMQHVWSWFSLHAAQRMQSINLFLVASAFVIGGYGAAFAAGNLLIAAVIAIAGLIIALSFLLLDSRNRELIRAAEVPLKILEERLAERSELPSLVLAATADKPRFAVATYSWVVRFLVGVMVVVTLLGGIAALIGLDRTTALQMTHCHTQQATAPPAKAPTCGL